MRRRFRLVIWAPQPFIQTMQKSSISGRLPVGGRALSTNINIAFSALNLILLRIT
ncbi:hypothetical protein Hanom_Chr13g01220901 [Helianthus anomalus]